MTDGGWVKLYRKSCDSDVFADADLWKLFCWCLMRAGRKKRTVSISTGRGRSMVTIAAGQFVFGRKAAAAELDIPDRTIYDRMHRIERLGSIRVEPNTHFSIVTIVNWGHYQSHDAKGQQATAGHLPGNQQQTNTNKKGENEEKGEKGKKDETRRDDQIESSSWKNWAEVKGDVERRCGELQAKVRFARPDNPQQAAKDRSLRVKACYLVECGLIPEDALHDAIEAVRNGDAKKRRPAAYFQSVLAENCRAKNINLNKRLAQAGEHIPESILKGQIQNEPTKPIRSTER